MRNYCQSGLSPVLEITDREAETGGCHGGKRLGGLRRKRRCRRPDDRRDAAGSCLRGGMERSLDPLGRSADPRRRGRGLDPPCRAAGRVHDRLLRSPHRRRLAQRPSLRRGNPARAPHAGDQRSARRRCAEKRHDVGRARDRDPVEGDDQGDAGMAGQHDRARRRGKTARPRRRRRQGIDRKAVRREGAGGRRYQSRRRQGRRRRRRRAQAQCQAAAAQQGRRPSAG